MKGQCQSDPCPTVGRSTYIVKRQMATVRKTGLPYISRICEDCFVMELRRSEEDTQVHVTVSE